MTHELIQELYSYFSTKSFIKAYKKDGKAVIGLLCNTVPEEIIHAAGAVPSRLIGTAENFELAPAKIPGWICNYAKRVFEDALSGKFDFVDGVVSSTSDDTKIHLFSAYNFYLKPEFSYLIQIPYVRDDLSRKFFVKELKRFAEKLSGFLQSEINDERIEYSISIYNRFRELLEVLNSMRMEDKPKLSGAEWMKIMQSSTSLLKEDINPLLEKLIEKLEERDGRGEYSMRVHLSGTDFHDIALIEMMESMGIAVVSDDFCTSFPAEQVNNGIEGIAENYLNQTACVLTSASTSIEERIEYIMSRFKESRAEGLIILRDRGCEICGHQCAFTMDAFRDVPTMVLDLDVPVTTEQYTTRIEAFIESYG
jgi:benzoyl-CoA reductase subunit C